MPRFLQSKYNFDLFLQGPGSETPYLSENCLLWTFRQRWISLGAVQKISDPLSILLQQNLLVVTNSVISLMYCMYVCWHCLFSRCSTCHITKNDMPKYGILLPNLITNWIDCSD